MTDEYVPVIKRLPGIFQEDGGFLENFLKAFEALLLEPADTLSVQSRAYMKSIRDILRNQEKYFDAYRTPPQFLEWLAGWVGYEYRKGEEFNTREDVVENSYESPIKQHLPLSAERSSYNRFFISEMVSVYQRRGTIKGIFRVINDFLEHISYSGYNGKIRDIVKEENVWIDEYIEPFILGKNSQVGKDTILGEPRPYYFHISIKVETANHELTKRIMNDISNILYEEKPAHVYYFFTASDLTEEVENNQY